MGFGTAEAAALRTTTENRRYMPGHLPLDVIATVQKEFLVPVLQQERLPDLAGRDARAAIEARLTG